MAVIFPILSTFDASGVNKAERAFKNLGGQAGVLGKSVSASSNLMKTALAGVGAASVVKGLQSAVMAASSLSESIAKSDTVFGKNAQAIQAWSKTTASALGVSRQAALEAAGTYGNLFRAFGISEQESAKMSQSLVTLAADLASFNNVPIEDALLALRSGLSGETEPLKRFGIALNEARLKEQALADGLIKTTKGTLPQAIKTQAAYALILKDSALAQGDVARTADGLANQLKFLKAGLEDAKAGFGEALLPAALSVVNAFNEKLLPAVQRVVEVIKLQGAGDGLKAVGTEVANVITNLEGTAKAVKDLILVFLGIKTVIPLVTALRTAWITVTATIGATATATQVATAVMKRALISTGIGALIVAAGFLVAKIYDVAIAAEATDKEVRFMESNGTKAFRNMGAAAQEANNKIARNIVTLNAVQLAATRAADAVDNAGIMDVKRGRIPTYAPVSVPSSNVSASSGAAGGAGKVAKAAAGVAKQAANAAAALGKMNDKLLAAREKLSQAREAFASFRDGVRDSINGLLNFGEAATGGTGTFLKNLRAQAAGIVSFSGKVQKLIQMGLSETAIQQVLSAGAEAGGKIADELIAGGASAIAETNALVKSVNSAATELGQAGATAFYQAGITQGQAMVNGIIAAIKKSGFRIVGGFASLPADLQKALDAGKLTKAQIKKLNNLLSGVPALAEGGIVNKPTLALIGEAGPEAVIPLSKMGNQGGNTYNLTVNAGIGADGAVIGREIVDAIKRYERTSGPVFASA
jgi:CRP-like cAMP-binding protein